MHSLDPAPVGDQRAAGSASCVPEAGGECGSREAGRQRELQACGAFGLHVCHKAYSTPRGTSMVSRRSYSGESTERCGWPMSCEGWGHEDDLLHILDAIWDHMANEEVPPQSGKRRIILGRKRDACNNFYVDETGPLEISGLDEGRGVSTAGNPS